jgi:uncharacterized membrane protein SirB2
MEQQPKITPRIGTFLILVGIGLLLMFIGSILASAPHYGYLFASFIILVIGSMLRRHVTHRESVGRFRVVRGILRRTKKDGKKKRRDEPSHFQ